MPTIDFLQDCLDEYGMSPIRAAHYAAHRWGPRAIRTGGAYVAAVRHAQGWASPTINKWGVREFPPEAAGQPDGRLLAPLWRECPVRPSDWPRIGAWLAYWVATQPRPDRVGPSHDDCPNLAVRAWRCGIPPHAYPRGLCALLPHPGERAGWARVDAVLQLHVALRLPPGQRAGNIVGYGDRPTLGTAEIRRLARLPRWVLRCVQVPRDPARPSRIDWPGLQAAIAAYRVAVPVRDLLDARVPYTLWHLWADGAQEEVRRLGVLATEVAAVHRQHLPRPVVPGVSEWTRRRGELRWCGSIDALTPHLTLHPHLQKEGGVLAVDAESGETLEVSPGGVLHAVVRGASNGAEREYRLRVPPWVRSVQEGVAWTYSLQPEEYAPAIRV